VREVLRVPADSLLLSVSIAGLAASLTLETVVSGSEPRRAHMPKSYGCLW
jgi:hypothetical protein